MIIQDEFSEKHPSSFPVFLVAEILYGALLLIFNEINIVPLHHPTSS
jgi:hypothetical protein